MWRQLVYPGLGLVVSLAMAGCDWNGAGEGRPKPVAASKRPAARFDALIAETPPENDTRSTCGELGRLPYGTPAYNETAHGKGPWAAAPVLQGPAATPAAVLKAAEQGPVVVRGVDLSEVSFEGRDLRGVCFENVRLASSRWRDARVQGVAFVRSDLSRADLRGRFRDSAFVSSVLDQAEASGADWAGSAIVGGTFSDLNLQGATLRGFALDCSANGFFYGDHCTDSYAVFEASRKSEPVDAQDADLTQARLIGWAGDWRVEGALVDGTLVEVDTARHLEGAVIRGPVRLSAVYTPGDAIALTPDEWRALVAASRAAPNDERPSPSFPCAGARSQAERLICDGGWELPDEDKTLARVYAEALARGRTDEAEQKAWLRQRDRCRDHDCLESRYRERLDALRRKLAPLSVPAPGEQRVFADQEVPLAAAFRGSALHRKLAPAILAQLGNTLYVRGLPDGRLEAWGAGVAFNGHTCSLSGGPFRFDEKTGWFMGRPQHGDNAAEEPVIRLTPGAAEVTPARDSEFAGCGMRGSWGEMVPIMTTPAFAAQVGAAMREREGL